MQQEVALQRDIAFALAVADLLELSDDLPLLPAVTAARLSTALAYKRGLINEQGAKSLATFTRSKRCARASPIKAYLRERRGDLVVLMNAMLRQSTWRKSVTF
jgi:hypothetical protein